MICVLISALLLLLFPTLTTTLRVGYKKMDSTYNILAQRAMDLYEKKKNNFDDDDHPSCCCWIGIVGGPGGGKSTLAKAVANRIHRLQRKKGSSKSIIRAVTIPMDGYHYAKAQLAEMENKKGELIRRRGAPWTFDALRLTNDLSKVQRKTKKKVHLPDYDRQTSDPVPNAITVDPKRHKIMLVEGNYLLLGRLLEDVKCDPRNTINDQSLPRSNFTLACQDLVCPTPIGDELRRWKDIAEIWDETWFVSPRNLKVQRQRLIRRSLRTWTPAKTQFWGGGTDHQAARKRSSFNDVRNAKLIECCRPYADVIVETS